MIKLEKLLAALALSCLTVAGCGGGTVEKPPVPDNPTAPPAPATQDEVFKYEPAAVQGMRFEPEALGLPGMWKISIPKRANLKKQRKIAAKDKASVPDLQILAGLAWQESRTVAAKARKEPDDAKKAKLDEQVTALRTEARDALRKAYEKAGEGKADEVTLKLLSVAELTLGNQDAAAKAYAEIAQRFAAEGASNAKIWLANIYLSQNKLTDAAKVVEGWQLAAPMDPMGAYVLAWVRFRQRRYTESTPAIVYAATGWKSATGKRVVQNDSLLFLSRAGVPVERAAQMEMQIVGDDKGDQYKALYNLSKGYEFSGYEDLAAVTLKMLLDGKVQPVPARDQVIFRAELAYDSLKIGDPAGCADAAIAAHQKLAECGDACKQDAANMTNAIKTYATLLHTLYAHSLDESYYAPAKKLYDYYLAIPGQDDTDVIKGYASRLDDTKANADPSKGKLDKDETQKLLKLRLNAVKACYESVLGAEPQLAGTVTLTVQVADTGEVTGAVSDPAKGAAGLAAVGGCLVDRAKAWRFPGRTLKGVTALVQPFTLSPAPAAQ